MIELQEKTMPFEDQFRRSLEDWAVPLCSEMDSDSTVLLLAFGGMAGSITIPPFEFFSLTAEMPVKRLFVRDLRQAWYHRGTPGLGSTISAVGTSLKQLIACQRVDRLVTVGSSAGGYAALVFGTLLDADRVLCFAPQTTIDPDILSRMSDHRWTGLLRDLDATHGLDSRWTDLRRALREAHREADTKYDLYFDHTFLADRLHAERLSEVDGVRLHGLQGGGHAIARTMRDTGQLERVLLRALNVGAN
jgi:pimeloyl-ACP methyl ester carboxylesterase